MTEDPEILDVEILDAEILDAELSRALARAGLGRVLDPALVAALREDSALPPAREAIAIAQAVEVEAAARGFAVRLGDADLIDVSTLGDLAQAIQRSAERVA